MFPAFRLRCGRKAVSSVTVLASSANIFPHMICAGFHFCDGICGEQEMICMTYLRPEDFVIEDGVLKTYTGKSAAVMIPDGVREIGEAAFVNARFFLREVVIPEGVARIGRSAFENCRYLQKITFPQSLREIGVRVFFMCSSLKKIALPAQVEAIGKLAFSDCKKLTEAMLPQALTEVADHLFSGCKQLAELVLPGGVTRIGSAAFMNCYSLRKITIPGRVTEIGEKAFQKCCNLAVIDYPNYTAQAEHFEATPYAVWAGRWMERHPGRPTPPVFPTDILGTPTGNWSGHILRELGFLFFEENRSYHICAPDSDGVVEVSSWCGDDGPDADGFGRKEYYDWWYLDEHLKPIPGVGCLHSCSNLDMRLPDVKERWQRAHHQAAQVLRKRREVTQAFRK